MLVFLLNSLFYETVQCSSQLRVEILREDDAFILKGKANGKRCSMDVRKYENGEAGPVDYNKDMLKLDIEEIKKTMKDPNKCRNLYYELCEVGKGFETGKTIFVQIKPLDAKRKGVTPFSILESTVVLNYRLALTFLKTNKVSLKVTSTNPFGSSDGPEEDTSGDKPGSSRKRRREETAAPKAKKAKKAVVAVEPEEEDDDEEVDDDDDDEGESDEQKHDESDEGESDEQKHDESEDDDSDSSEKCTLEVVFPSD
ncbi:rhoGAP protein [Ecytonucleospora hepatopenaei]|uniref:RhoGAP protein n=1 Tax=Ecytonucleospora hepatopenaei TaxID=646526 RepID=A0A1W0E6D9_9MICR|nr:rhoGAP protein [Ecytonucleospora hepatopenaei]